MSDMPEPIVIEPEQEERRGDLPEITLRDRRTGKLRTVHGVVWEFPIEPHRPVRTLELWMRHGRRGRLAKVVSLRDRREAARWGDRDPEEPDLELLAAYWMGY